jgi:hypothetical protein
VGVSQQEGLTMGEKPEDLARATTVKGSKSNTSERTGGFGDDDEPTGIAVSDPGAPGKKDTK